MEKWVVRIGVPLTIAAIMYLISVPSQFVSMAGRAEGLEASLTRIEKRLDVMEGILLKIPQK